MGVRTSCGVSRLESYFFVVEGGAIGIAVSHRTQHGAVKMCGIVLKMHTDGLVL